MSAHVPQTKQVTLRSIAQMKPEGQKITMVTADDAATAKPVDAAGIDMILVGDSLGMVVKGEPNTLGVTLEQAAYHTAAVARGVGSGGRAHIVGDMPFMSYQASAEQAMQNA